MINLLLYEVYPVKQGFPSITSAWEQCGNTIQVSMWSPEDLTPNTGIPLEHMQRGWDASKQTMENPWCNISGFWWVAKADTWTDILFEWNYTCLISILISNRSSCVILKALSIICGSRDNSELTHSVSCSDLGTLGHGNSEGWKQTNQR